ncbi:MAG: hypothetical protein IJQ21_10490 [Lachnospiraceae bacterium]|nr:hypothetical protein [Lachnospiraceae bacterium]
MTTGGMFVFDYAPHCDIPDLDARHTAGNAVYRAFIIVADQVKFAGILDNNFSSIRLDCFAFARHRTKGQHVSNGQAIHRYGGPE